MFNPEIFAVNFARTVDLLRERLPNKETQKASLRAVYALTSLASATVRLYDGVLSVDDTVVPQDLPYLEALKRQMDGHAVAEVALARGTTATELLALLRALAVDVGTFAPGDGVAQRVAASGASGIAVLAARRDEEPSERRAPSVTQAFELAAIEEAGAAAAPSFEWVEEPGPIEPPVSGVQEIPTAAAIPQAAPARPEPPAAPPAEEPAAEQLPETLAAPHGVPADTTIGIALGAVTRDPYGPHILDHLSDLAGEVGAALRDGPIELAVQAIAAVIGLETGAPEGSPKSSYGIVLKRMLTREPLKRIAHLLPDPRFAPIATAVMRRAGAEGADVLVELLTVSAVPRDRKAFLGAIRVIPRGTLHVIHMLQHHQWVVVRNVAELLGELRVEEAVADLGKLLMHYEPRVRRAAVVALAKIGTVATVDALRRAMKDGTPELRALVAGSIGGQHSRALAMPLVTLAAEEDHEEVLCEYYRALGRIGTPEAVDALMNAAQPGGRIFGRRAARPRIAAVEALRSMPGTAPRRALEALKNDGDKAVRDAVQRVLSTPVGSSPATAGGR